MDDVTTDVSAEASALDADAALAEREKAEREADEKLLEQALEHFEIDEQFERHDRTAAADNLRFVAGDGQWPDSVRGQREREGRPVLTINCLRAFVKQVTNEARRNRPAVKVLPVEDADKDRARIMQGMVRHIESKSRAQSVYMPAFENAVKGGFRGSWRIVTQYAGNEGFEQEIRIVPIRSPFAVYWDSDARAADKSDARRCFVVEEMSKSAFERKYPKHTPSDWKEAFSGTRAKLWISGDMVRVAEYWVVKDAGQTVLSLLDNGDVAEGDAEQWQAEDGTVVSRVASRVITRKKVCRYVLSGHAVLEREQEFHGEHIPIVSVEAPREWIDDHERGVSLIHDAKDSQRMYNYWRTTIAEKIALAPKAPFLVTPNQIQGLDGFWQRANTANLPYLPYNPDPQSPGAPQRQMPAMVNAAELQEAAQAIDDIKATTGIFDASLGAQSNETSGRAILARQSESDNATYDYIAQFEAAIERTGRILVDIIPLVYSTAKTIRILGEDDSVVATEINTSEETMLAGKYDIEVVTGPSYATKRLEAADSMMAFVQAVPSAGQIGGDVIARNMDWPGSDELAERLKKTLPPGIIEGEDEEMSPEQMQQRQAMAQQQAQQQQIAQAGAMADIEQKAADAALKRAQAEKVQVEAAMSAQQLQMAPQQLQLMVQQAVAQALASLIQQPPPIQ